MRLISKADFARERKVHPSRVSQWLRSKRIAADENGRIDADAAHLVLDQSLDQAKGARPGGNVTSTSGAAAAASATGDLGLDNRAEQEPEAPGGKPPGNREDGDYWKSRTRQAAAEAQLKEMQVLERSGALVSAAEVERELREIFRLVRNMSLAIPDRIAAVLDPASPSRAHKLLTDELQKGLRELSDRLAARATVVAAADEREEALQ